MPSNIRLVRTTDIERMLAIYAPLVRDTIISFELEPPTLAELRHRIESSWRQFPWLACERDGRILGYAYATKHRSRPAYQWCAECSVYVHEDARSRGVGRAVYTSLFAVLKLQGFYNVYAGIALPNPASIALHKACGFTDVGVYRRAGHKLGAWHDVSWWQLRLRDLPQAPAPPVDLSAVEATAEFTAALAAGIRHLRM